MVPTSVLVLLNRLVYTLLRGIHNGDVPLVLQVRGARKGWMARREPLGG